MRETADARRESDAIDNARDRVARLEATYGANHPEFATGLNQLALLLIMQGEPVAAEPLLRSALEIRRECLGTRHPDYATNLSSLGGLLWSRGDLDQAEPLLREAAAVHSEALGPTHPKTLVSVHSLEQLLKLKAEVDPTAQPEPADFLPGPSPEESFQETRPVAEQANRLPIGKVIRSEQFEAGLESVRASFESLGRQLTQIAEALRGGIVPVDDDYASARSHASEALARLRSDVLEAVDAYSVPLPSLDISGLDDLALVLPGLREAESARDRVEMSRQEALEVLDRVDRLDCPSDAEFAPLSACRDQGRDLRRTIEAANPAELPEEARRLGDGSHPLSVLLKLVNADESNEDTEWAEWYDAVVAAFGNALAVAAARSRFRLGAPQKVN